MKFDLVKDEMSMLIENMSEQFEMISQHDTSIPQIELDIFMRNIQKLYENAIYLNRVNQDSTTTAIELKENNETEKEEIAEVEVQKKEEKEIEFTTEEKNVSTTTKEPENIIEEIKEETIFEEKTVETSDKPEEKAESKVEETNPSEIAEQTLSFEDILDEPKQENDLFSNVKANSEIVDLNKKLAEARNTQSIVEKLQTKRIESLKTVIGINDKFYFINELFSGDSQKYEDIIYTLNNFKKLEDAMVYFSTLKYKFGWDEDTEAYEKLSQMLERKFEMANA